MGGKGSKMTGIVMAAVGVIKMSHVLQLLCLLQSVTLCHTTTFALSQRGGGKGGVRGLK